MLDILKAIEPDVLIKGVATLRMFIAAHNTSRPGEYVTGEELELIEDTANELDLFLGAYKQYREISGRGGG